MGVDVFSLRLEAKRVAGLIGKSVHTLGAARMGKPYLAMPPHEQHGTRGVRYRLIEVIKWSEFRGIRLNWDALPLSMRVDAHTAAYLQRAAEAFKGVPQPCVRVAGYLPTSVDLRDRQDRA